MERKDLPKQLIGKQLAIVLLQCFAASWAKSKKNLVKLVKNLVTNYSSKWSTGFLSKFLLFLLKFLILDLDKI